MAAADDADAKDGTATMVGGPRIPFWRLVVDQAGITPAVAGYRYPGSGTEEDPFLIDWIPNDPRNPMAFRPALKWFITGMAALATLAVTLVSSAYSGTVRQIIEHFHISQEVATLGISLFVLGFAVGPLVWAPLSELFGRQLLFIGTYAALTAFNGGCVAAQNPWTLIILRFLGGAFGSSPLTNGGGTIADMFSASQRGLALSFFAAAPFLGPVLGPFIAGFIGMNAGWRWVMAFLTFFSGTIWVLASLLVPETYAPVLLRRRAARLSRMTGRCYVSRTDHATGKVTLAESLRAALLRPWVLLFTEPIVLLLSTFMAIVYGTLYMLFGAFPIVYQRGKGWNQGVGGLAFFGIFVGMLGALAYTIPANRLYLRAERRHGGMAPPEARLPAAIIGAVALPVGLFWFAWTNGRSVHWLASVAAGAPFGFGMVLVFLGIFNYLIDAYTIFAASVLAANSVLRSLFGAAFPLFTTYMFNNLGIHWAASVPAFLALGCVPFPVLFYRYGPAIRKRCKFASESAAFVRRLQEGAASSDGAAGDGADADDVQDAEAVAVATGEGDEQLREEKDDEDTIGAASSTDSGGEGPVYEPIAGTYSRASAATRASSAGGRKYEGNPYDVDRLNSRQSFASGSR
ncbi:hypothetical protein CDD83_10930 [Cordyceps sp. RAO-2017]|nr:hypothetical protein CDD83_10930 [Cordyceps sp. RAO-2017]